MSSSKIHEVVENHKYPPFITKYDRYHGTTRLHMNLAKRWTLLTDVEVDDYILLGDTWHKVEQKVGVFPDLAKQFFTKCELPFVPKMKALPYFAYENLNLKKDASYHVVRRDNMEDIVEFGGKETIGAEYAKRTVRHTRRTRTENIYSRFGPY